MAKIVKHYSTEEMVAMRGQRGKPTIDLLSPYMEMLGPLEAGNGLELELEEGDKPQVIKRRLTSASKVIGKEFRWRKARDRHLLLEVLPKPDASKPKQTRNRRTKAEIVAASETPS